MKNRKELERLIVDASDGMLTASEIENLEKELRRHPDLFDDYHTIMNLPNLANLYSEEADEKQHQLSIRAIQQRIRNISEEANSFEVISLNWFRRYALAAALALFAITSLLSTLQPEDDQVYSEEVVEEMYYPTGENSLAENYVIYLEDLPED